MKYDYMEAMKADVREYIENEIDRADFDDKDELYNFLNDELWTADSVTGNGSGSYTFSRAKAKEYVTEGGMDYLQEACKEFDVSYETIGKAFIEEDYEYMDVTIRCYLLSQAISEVLDELDEEGYFDTEES